MTLKLIGILSVGAALAHTEIGAARERARAAPRELRDGLRGEVGREHTAVVPRSVTPSCQSCHRAVVRGSCRCHVQWQCASSRCTPSRIPSGGGSVRSGALSPAPRHPTPTVSIHFASWPSWSGRVDERASACSRPACTCPYVRSMTQSGHWNPKESYRRRGCPKQTMPPYGSIDHPRETASRAAIRLAFQPLGGRRSW